MYVSLRLPLVLAISGILAAFAPSARSVIAAIDGAILALLVLDVMRAPPAARLRVERDLPAAFRTGEAGPVSIALHNPTSRRVRIALRDASPPSARRSPVRHTASLPPRAWLRLTAEIRPERRGFLALGPVTARTAGPLGLGGRQSTLPLTTRVKVYPPLPGRAETELRLERARLLQTGERSSRIRGGGTEFESLQDYHPDDEFRRINWKATARSPRPISNVYREERNQQVVLLLDASRMMAASIGAVSRFEHALDASVATAELAGRIGDRVGMLAFGAQVVAQLPPRGGRVQSARMLEALFALEPRLEAPNYRRAFAALLTLQRRRALVVLFTELAERSALEGLFDALPVLLSRHLVIVGSVIDPELQQLADAAASSSEEAYVKAAAAAELHARASVAAHLRRLGATPLDRRPGRLAGAVVDEYLKIKAFGRL